MKRSFPAVDSQEPQETKDMLPDAHRVVTRLSRGLESDVQEVLTGAVSSAFQWGYELAFREQRFLQAHSQFCRLLQEYSSQEFPRIVSPELMLSICEFPNAYQEYVDKLQRYSAHAHLNALARIVHPTSLEDANLGRKNIRTTLRGLVRGNQFLKDTLQEMFEEFIATPDLGDFYRLNLK